MSSAYAESAREDVHKILEEVTTIYEKLSGRPYEGPKDGEPVSPIPAGVDPVEFLNQEYRYLMSLVNSGALRSPFSVPYVWAPPAEVLETQKEILVRLDLPGVDRSDVSLSVQNNQVLVVRGERRFRKSEPECSFLIMERTCGEFVKQIPLPDKVDARDAEARLGEGMLEIRIPKIGSVGQSEDQQVRIR
jgi:HSP20 family molecular chaperone IbpA